MDPSVVWRVFRWFQGKGDICSHPLSVNPVSCNVKSTWFVLTRKQPPQGACNVMILVNMYTYIFNSLITCILFVFPFCSSGWNEALESHHLQSTAIMNWFLYSLTGRLTLISVLHMVPDNKHFILRLFLFCLCFGSVLSFQQAICTENYEVIFSFKIHYLPFFNSCL